MRGTFRWIAAQFDNGVTLLGGILALAVTLSALGALLAFSSGHTVVAGTLATAFIAGLALMLGAALTTDRNPKLSAAERAALWAKTPAFIRWGISLLIGGQLVDLLLGSLSSFQAAGLVSSPSFAVASIIFARGLRRHKPPLPRAKREPLQFESSPEEYAAAIKPLVLSLYIGAAAFSAMFVNDLLLRVP